MRVVRIAPARQLALFSGHDGSAVTQFLPWVFTQMGAELQRVEVSHQVINRILFFAPPPHLH
jgi:uncharacterized alpha-E superfamily protein